MPPRNANSTTSVDRHQCDDKLQEARSLPVQSEHGDRNIEKSDQSLRAITTTTSGSHDRVLKGLYLVTCYLCVSMFSWIMFTPASWLMGHSAFHRQVLLPLLVEMGVFFLVPTSIVTKYSDQHAIHLTHILPGALWVAILPFQLHPTWRNTHRKLHRILGYIFLAASLLIATGVFIILDRDLTYHHFFEELPPMDDRGEKVFFAALTLWFARTGIQAVRMARARDIGRHQKWMLRHVAAGIWVAAQRMLVLPVCIGFTKAITHPPPMQPSQWLQREIFGKSAIVAIVLCVGASEIAWSRISKSKPPSSTNHVPPGHNLALTDDLTESSSDASELQPTKQSTRTNESTGVPGLRVPRTVHGYSTGKDDAVLAGLYIIVSTSCAAMIWWILMVPASSLIERSSFHQEIVIPLVEALGGFRVVPKHIVTKYESHILVQLTHILPAAIWSGIIPFQLHPTWRHHHRKLHRRLGYIFSVVSLSMAFGVCVIVERNLTFEHYFPDVPVPDHSVSAQIATPAILLMALWFVMTLLRAISMARAGKTQLHQKWMVRHVASGIWVIFQRYLIIPCYIVYAEIIWPRPMEVPSWFQMKTFADSGIIAGVISLCLGEFTIRRMTFLRSEATELKKVL